MDFGKSLFSGKEKNQIVLKKSTGVQSMNHTILLIPRKTDPETKQVLKAWTNRKGEIKKLDKYWVKDKNLVGQNLAIYGNQTFALVLAQIYGVELVSPDDKMIASLDRTWTKRVIEIKTIAEIMEDCFPTFIKPVIPKSFIASIFYSLEEFEKATKGLEKTEELMISTIIDDITAEARGYLKNGKVKDLALYHGNADIKEGKLFLQNFAEMHSVLMPEVVVTDIAYSKNLGWFVLEFNACWGAGLNNCDADKIIDCIIEATKNPSN